MIMESSLNRKINQKSIILPELIPLRIPGFLFHSEPFTPLVLSFSKKNSEQCFYEFINLVESKIGKQYFPIMRMSDGEFILLVNHTYPVFSGVSFFEYFKKVIKVFKAKILNKDSFKAATLPNISSGDYTFSEIRQLKDKIKEEIKDISEKGVLALHLTYSKKPFQEQYHYKLNRWFVQNGISLTESNYYPFYFVYAMLRGEERKRFLYGRTVLLIHSATGDKKMSITRSLLNEGVKSIIWHEISSNRSLFDKINLEPSYFKAEIAFVGAGVGKFNIFSQLEPLGIPCIDAGYIFEVWANDDNKWLRPMMVNDAEWDSSKILFDTK